MQAQQTFCTFPVLTDVTELWSQDLLQKTALHRSLTQFSTRTVHETLLTVQQPQATQLNKNKSQVSKVS